MRREPHNLVLAYQGSDDARRESAQRLWLDLADVVAYAVVWGVVGAVVAALLGSVVLWGVLLASAAQ